jgi:hypothetical protein
MYFLAGMEEEIKELDGYRGMVNDGDVNHIFISDITISGNLKDKERAPSPNPLSDPLKSLTLVVAAVGWWLAID